MPTHHETRILPYTPKQLFGLVADVERYPEFLPWCLGTRINWRKENSFNADVIVGYKFFRETFNSTVTLTPDERIEVTYQSGPFAYLNNYWLFKPIREKRLLHCEITFFIDFRFRSTILSSVIRGVFEEAVKRMIDAFEKRATAVMTVKP